MRIFLILVTLLTFNGHVQANTVEQYVNTKDGITLYALISKGSVEERKIQDAFLDRLIQKLRRKDKSIPIFLLTDQFSLFDFSRDEWFASISYDTLRSPDPMFLENYFYYRMGPEYQQHIQQYSKPPSGKHKIDLPEPIDIGSTYNNNKAPLGLKIIYDYGVTDSATSWDRLYTLVQYAIDHINEIKDKQARIILPYPVSYLDTSIYKTEVSLLTIDTSLIRHIPLHSFGFDLTKVNEEKNISNYILMGLIFIVLLMAVIIIRLRMKSANILFLHPCFV
jgi:hypothetical protein